MAKTLLLRQQLMPGFKKKQLLIIRRTKGLGSKYYGTPAWCSTWLPLNWVPTKIHRIAIIPPIAFQKSPPPRANHWLRFVQDNRVFLLTPVKGQAPKNGTCMALALVDPSNMGSLPGRTDHWSVRYIELIFQWFSLQKDFHDISTASTGNHGTCPSSKSVCVCVWERYVHDIICIYMNVVLNKSSQEPPFRKPCANLSPAFAVP